MSTGSHSTNPTLSDTEDDITKHPLGKYLGNFWYKLFSFDYYFPEMKLTNNSSWNICEIY